LIASSEGSAAQSALGASVPHDWQHALFGSVAQALVDRGKVSSTPGLAHACADIQPIPPSLIEQSFSSVSMMMATSESGRRNARRCARSASSVPRATACPFSTTISDAGFGSIRKRYQASSVAS
jgi:hypothetical protein